MSVFLELERETLNILEWFQQALKFFKNILRLLNLIEYEQIEIGHWW